MAPRSPDISVDYFYAKAGPYVHKEENNKESEPIIEAVVTPANLENQKLRARQTKSSGRINF